MGLSRNDVTLSLISPPHTFPKKFADSPLPQYVVMLHFSNFLPRPLTTSIFGWPLSLWEGDIISGQLLIKYLHWLIQVYIWCIKMVFAVFPSESSDE